MKAKDEKIIGTVKLSDIERMNLLCKIFGHKFPQYADAHYIGLGYERDEWRCRRMFCRAKESIKRPTRWVGRRE